MTAFASKNVKEGLDRAKKDNFSSIKDVFEFNQYFNADRVGILYRSLLKIWLLLLISFELKLQKIPFTTLICAIYFN